MANSYTQLYVQMVFAVKNRQSLILPENRIKIEKYICGIASNIHCYPISIYCKSIYKQPIQSSYKNIFQGRIPCFVESI